MIHKCFRKMSVCFLVGLSIVMLTACGGNGNSQSSNKSSKDKGYEESAEKMELKIEDIDWRVEESILDGEKFLSLNYTNNSDYTIMDVEITFKQKEGLTAEQLSVFDEYKEMLDLSDEEVAEIYILGYNRKCTRPGESGKDSPLVLNGTYHLAESTEQYDLMEPDTISVAFIGSDDKGYVMYYDYNSQVYGSSTHDATDIHQWSDKELAKLIDVPECVATSVDIDDDCFWFNAYGVKKDMYKRYVEDVKSKGFTEDVDEDDDSYEAKNADGEVWLIDINVSKLYHPENHEGIRYTGTLNYAAPEQIGFGIAASTPGTDIYAVGVLLNVMLTGHLPQERKAKQPMWDIIKKCISFEVDDRYTASELIDELERIGDI